jgi:hypothetical protein
MSRIGIQRILSLLIAIGYVTYAIVHSHGFTEDVFMDCIALLFVLALIWFPDELGNATCFWTSSSMSMTQVDKPTPAILISIFGWLFLIGPLVLWYFYG